MHSSPLTRAGPSAACLLLSRIPITWRACRPCTGRARSLLWCRPRPSAPCARLEAAGAVIYAKTTTPEFCYAGTTPGHVEPARPFADPWRVLGRSRGGARLRGGPLGLGGDGGGSIRIPAAFCGVVGFKPTFGAVPREPSSQGWKTLVAYGPMARTVADTRLMFDVLAGPDPYDRHSTPTFLKRARPSLISRRATRSGRWARMCGGRFGPCARSWARWRTRPGCRAAR